jgi:hypothetical protein
MPIPAGVPAHQRPVSLVDMSAAAMSRTAAAMARKSLRTMPVGLLVTVALTVMFGLRARTGSRVAVVVGGWWMTLELKEHDDRWTLVNSEAKVSRVAIDWAVSLTVEADSAKFEIRIESEFHLTTPEGQSITLNPEGNPFGLAPILGLVRHDVTRVDAFKDGRLEVGFANEALLSVAESDDFEPWAISGQDRMRIVSVPGSEVAMWTGDE